jgi:dTMP kinase
MLITFEGIDGSGKSTQARLLVEHLQSEDYSVLLVREPGGTALSERIRTLLLDPALDIEPFAELLLFSAARAQLVTEKIRPALRAHQIVVCDRFYDSTTAYQGAGRQLETPDWLRGFHQKVTGGLVPDRTYLVEVPPATAQARRSSAPKDEAAGAPEPDRMEAGGEAFYQRVAAAYNTLAQEEPGRFVRLDGEQPIERIHAQIRADLHAFMTSKLGTGSSGDGSSDA